MPNQDATQVTVRAVDRALDILLCLSRADDGMNLSEIARAVHLHKSTVHRLMMSLLQKGFLRKHPQSDKYLLGWSVLQLITNIYQSDELSAICLPEMNRLRDTTGETVSLYIRTGLERLRIQAVQSNEPVRNVADVGKTYPLFVGASGKVLLAFSEPSLVEQVLQEPSVPEDFNREELLKQLDEIRIDGYAISIKERDAGAAALAAPIFGRNHFQAALSVSGPVSRFTQDKMTEYIETILQSSSRISKLLSH